MKCFKCGEPTKVVRTEQIGSRVYRTRACLKCEAMSKTFEKTWVEYESKIKDDEYYKASDQAFSPETAS